MGWSWIPTGLSLVRSSVQAGTVHNSICSLQCTFPYFQKRFMVTGALCNLQHPFRLRMTLMEHNRMCDVRQRRLCPSRMGHSKCYLFSSGRNQMPSRQTGPLWVLAQLQTHRTPYACPAPRRCRRALRFSTDISGRNTCKNLIVSFFMVFLP